MVLIKEFRVLLPCSVEEYQVGQLYSVAQTSKDNTGGGEGIEVLTNQPYEGGPGERGQFTHKIYHLQSKVPGFVRLFAPEGSLVFHEKAWNAYPYCRTVITNEYMKDDFFIKIETWHHPDMGTQDNVHHLDAETWKEVEVVHIDIADRTQVSDEDYKPEEDPALFKSVKTGRGPLGPDWQQEKRLFTNFHRQLFCWLDRWVDLSMEEIRRLEEETQRELDQMRQMGPVRGMTASDD
ncbi:phosphatidylinositol transfer protein beta isoform-like isoform X2 [Ornithorhynchus anatinus]|uniref:phosphatidylinositol transfer protein beta isoform-like isoform X2 n=1 Tax=Ornithorhynchus anatinus TaxID=9258 RepID=UPI0010A94BB7|nr:phosphatidylinositol transfer protein beta isoform-like isoform X2 [Ornithorhynchus anatinus]